MMLVLSILSLPAFVLLIAFFLFAEHRIYRMGRSAWFWPSPKGQWLLARLRLRRKSDQIGAGMDIDG